MIFDKNKISSFTVEKWDEDARGLDVKFMYDGFYFIVAVPVSIDLLKIGTKGFQSMKVDWGMGDNRILLRDEKFREELDKFILNRLEHKNKNEPQGRE